MKCLFIAMLIVISVAACKTTNEIEIKSAPEKSKVYLIDKAGNKDLIGETPTQISADDRLFRSSSVARISIEKEGYVSESFILNKSSMPKKDSLELTLKDSSLVGPEAGVKQREASSRENMNELASGAAIVQAHCEKEYDVALIKLSDLSAKFPYISVVWDLLGNVYYIEKKYEEALDSYEKSLALDSTNASTSHIVKRLKEI